MALCIVQRNDEGAGAGVQFDDLRTAMEHIKNRASTETKTIHDYVIIPILET
jgi:hypothetical protein